MPMHEQSISPRFCDTDALGHISNTTIPVWFEMGRGAVFERVHPSGDLSTWPLIVVHIEADMKKQLFYGTPAVVKTGVEKLGNSSLHLYQEIWQNDQLAASGRVVLVYFDYKTQQPNPIPDAVRERLSDLFVSPDEING